MPDVNNTPSLPLPNQPDDATDNVSRNDAAASLIRNKIDRLYQSEPDAKDELKESLTPGKHSKHQQYLASLHDSGQSKQDIEAAWHAYYVGLSNEEKHEVWREFYAHQNALQEPATDSPKQSHAATHVSGQIAYDADHQSTTLKELRQAKQSKPNSLIKDLFKGVKLPQPLDSIVNRKPKAAKERKQESSTSKAKRELKSLGFGLSIGLVFLSLYMFTFFNERFIIPFVQPSTIASATPIITEPGVKVDEAPVVIVPKLNTQAPVVYDVPFIQPGESPEQFEERTQEGLERGVVHYPTSQLPGQTGLDFNSNVVIVGHSSNNIFNSGDFKFAFMNLRNLVNGDTFMINYKGTQYVYKVYEMKIVPPTEVSVLGSAARPNSATLITCDPPGFSTNRLIVIGEQISPSPATNVYATQAALQPSTPTIETQVPGNPETLWTRLIDWIF